MRAKWKTLVIALVIPLGVGGLSALLTRKEMDAFSHLNQPPLSPPTWLFPVVWTILFLLMGLASWLVYRSDAPDGVIRRALTVYGIQLGVNFLWSILFFNLKWYLFSFFWLLLLWGLILVTMILFFPIRKPAGWLLVPYVLWVTFAGYLNFGIYLLN
ncbi:MAG: tryptophan-rich sensory protein [Ruminiclostridium sp.]|nr:tryptophan-rich sensory protein [Ruminiclostridium sp.]